MGYLDKSTITVDAILTNRGRELLSQGDGSSFQITKFALADDEVDYRLYNRAHPLGDRYYGSIIENMPVLEATPDETQTMRYKLVTISGADLVDGGVIIPQLTITPPIAANGTVSLNYDATKGTPNTTITPQTTYTAGSTSAESFYTLLLADSSVATVEVTNPATGLISPNARGSITATGKSFKLSAKNIGTNITRSTSVTIFGGQSGAVRNFTLSITG